MMFVLPASVVKLQQTCFSHFKCNIAWVLSLYNTSSLNMKTTYFEILLSVGFYFTRSQCISFEKSKMKYIAGL